MSTTSIHGGGATIHTVSGQRILTVVLAMLTAFGAISIDMYLPAFAGIKQNFGMSDSGMQLSLSVFLIGLAVGQAALGPLTDSFGRRRFLLGGVALFVGASCMIALAPVMQIFLLGRFLQGLGAAAGQSIPRSIVTDIYDTRQSVKIFSVLLQIFALAPIIAPFAGNLLMAAGWRLIFWVLAAFGLLALFAAARFVPETQLPQNRKAFSFTGSLRTYASLLGTRSYISIALASSLSIATIFAYISASPFILMEYFKVSPTVYSLIFAANAAGQMAFSQASIMLAARLSPQRHLAVGFAAHLCAVVALAACICLGFTSMNLILVLLFFVISTLPLILGGLTSAVMFAVPREMSGTGSALLGVMQYALGGLAGLLLGVFHTGTLVPFAVIVFACSGLSFVAWRISQAVAPNVVQREAATRVHA